MATPGVTLTDRDREVYRTELAPWLPRRMLDAHVHVFERACFPDGYKFDPKNLYVKFGGEHPIGLCLETARALLPDVEYGLLCFGTPDAVVDREAAARYSASVADNERVFSLALVSPKDPIQDVERWVRQYGLLGYKPYHCLAKPSRGGEVSIPDMLTDAQMRLADALGLVVMFHIPRARRLADPDNQREMVRLARRYPNARIIFAHIGRAYYMQNVAGNLDGIAACPNAYVDIAMVNHPGVLEYAFRHFPRERILFGSDAPVAWLRGKSVEVNNQYAYLTGEDYRIGTMIYDAEHAVEFTFFFYEMLRGIKEAADRAGLTRSELEGLFHGNAHALLRDAASRARP